MNKNDVITLEIEDMGVDGEGIGKYEGMTFFVKDALIGDSIRARIIKLKKIMGLPDLRKFSAPLTAVWSRSVRCTAVAVAVRFRRWIMWHSFLLRKRRYVGI